MKNFDLTNGNIIKKLLLVAIPIMFTQLAQMAYNLTDMFWLGKLGSKAVASSGTAGMYMWLSMAFIFVGRMGSEIGVSQSIGKQERDSAKLYARNSVMIALFLGIICTVITSLFSTQMISFFNVKELDVAADAVKYLVIVGSVCPFVFTSSAMIGAFNGSGNSRLPFVANAIGLGLNMILDPLLIFTFKLGIIGAAVATAVAQVTVFVVLLFFIKKAKSRPFEKFGFFIKPDYNYIIQIIRWSLPIALESLFFTLLAMVTTRFVAQFGSSAISVQRIGSQVESLSWLIGGGFGSALTAFVGQNYGAKKWGRIKKGFKLSIVTLGIWGVIVTFALFIFGRQIFSIFLREPELQIMGEAYLKILAACQITSCLESISNGIFRGLGRTIPPSLVSICSNTIRVPLAYFLSLTSLGIDGIWLGITIGAIIRGIWITVWYLIYSKKLPSQDQAQIA